jgi:hypothetical protein
LSLKKVSEAKANRRQGDSVFTERRGAYAGDSTDSLEVQFANHCQALGFSDPLAVQVWFDNLERLALLKVDRYSDLNLVPTESERMAARLQEAEYRYLYITGFGEGFISACTPTGSENAL